MYSRKTSAPFTGASALLLPVFDRKSWGFMMRVFLIFSLAALGIVLISCSGRSSIPSAQMPNISGSWEFIASSSTNPGYSTGIEVALNEGQALVDGAYVANGQISASGSQINLVGFTPTGGIIFGGNCTPATNNTGNSLTGSISGFAGTMNFTYTENGNIFNVTATLDASGQSIDSGTYTTQTGSGCSDSGTIAGKIVPKLSGSYTGELTLPGGTSGNVTATVNESSSSVLTANLIVTGSDNTAFSLSGPVTGNYFSATGTFSVGGQIQSATYDGYYELTYDSLTSVNDIPTLYIVNATNSTEPTYAGTLMVPQSP